MWFGVHCHSPATCVQPPSRAPCVSAAADSAATRASERSRSRRWSRRADAIATIAVATEMTRDDEQYGFHGPYLNLNSTATSTITSTGCPSRVAGAKRHCRTAAMARSFSPLGRPLTSFDVAHRSVAAHDDLQHDFAFEVPPARLFGVAGLHFSQESAAARCRCRVDRGRRPSRRLIRRRCRTRRRLPRPVPCPIPRRRRLPGRGSRFPSAPARR